MEHTMKCSVLVATAGVLVGQDLSLVRRGDGHRVLQEVGFVFTCYESKKVLRLSLTNDTWYVTNTASTYFIPIQM